jgi:hypothetical protein
VTDIIELIDNAVWDTWESPDAMRWMPDPPAADRAISTVARLFEVPPELLLGVSPLEAAAREPVERWAFRQGESFHNPPGMAIDVMLTTAAVESFRASVARVHVQLTEAMQRCGGAFVRMAESMKGMRLAMAPPATPQPNLRRMRCDYSRRLRARRKRRRG